MNTVIIGLGNPILTDNALGIRATRMVRDRLSREGIKGIVVSEVHMGGLKLMEALEGYERAIVVDAMHTGCVKPGTIARQPESTYNLRSSHDTGLDEALSLGRDAGLSLPLDVRVLGMEGEDLKTFSEELTPGVNDALPLLVNMIMDEVHS
ncbi:hydrogenase maturation protease [Nitrospirota bacterium]